MLMVKDKIITMYTVNDCGQCKMSKRIMTAEAEKKGYSLDQLVSIINLDEQPNETIREELKAQGFKGAPISIIENNSPLNWVGFRPDKIKNAFKDIPVITKQAN